jgi:biotin synthase
MGLGRLATDELCRAESLTANGVAQARFHQRADAARREVFGDQVFVRGVVEISNFCRQNCHYCAMRRDNRALQRYRMAVDQLLELIVHHRPASITDIDIQAGEDPVVVREVVVPLVRALRRHTNLGVTLCLGTLSAAEYDALRDSGADYYVLKLESGDAGHYAAIAAPGTLEQRLDAIRYLAASGWRVSSGLMIGLPGQSLEQLLQSLVMLTNLPLAGASVSPFIAGPQTPLVGAPNGDADLTLNCVAWMRLAAPQWIIPAVSAMNLVTPDGYLRALNAGANLTTINLTPDNHRADYPIYTRDRVVMLEERVLTAIQRTGHRPSPIGVSQYLRNAVAPSLT